MKGKIAETQFIGRAGFEGLHAEALPGPEIVADEIEAVVFDNKLDVHHNVHI